MAAAMCISIFSLFIAVHLVAAATDNEKSLNEIPWKCRTEEREVDVDSNTSTHPDNDLDEDSIFDKDIQISKNNDRDDEPDSHKSNKEAFERNETSFPPKSSSSKSKERKKRETSCANANQPEFNCDAESKYRTFNGACNNLKHPERGMAKGCQERMVKANYEDESNFRKSVEGGPLPEPRSISLHIFIDQSRVHKKLNHMYVFFGQFFAHDLSLTQFYRKDTGEILPCCLPDLEKSPKCINVYAQKNDPFYGPLNHFCMDLSRTIPCGGCDEKGIKMINENTAFLDGSAIYGNSEEIAMSLRRNDGTGKLISQTNSNGELLPNSSNPRHDQCSFPDKGLLCFEAGDGRVNQHLMLTIFHTVFMREHNRIASILKEINPWWEEEKLYHETRRILGAIIQVLVFKEYLPIVLSPKTISLHRLNFTEGFTTYNDTLNPSIRIEFSTAAFRTPHSSINTVVSKKPRNVTDGHEWLRDLYFFPFGLFKGGFGPLMEDITTTPAQMIDRFAVTDIINFLYRLPGDPGGLDLQAIDIQRGRDTGLPTYVQMVEYCHGIKITSFNDSSLSRFMTSSNVKLLKGIYKSIKDVDLHTALQMEKKEEDSIYGETATCIVVRQFYIVKYGDRFYFEHGNQTGSFTIDQINELKKASLTKILCKNVKEILYLPENAMQFESKKNKRVYCNKTEDMDFFKWKEVNE